MKYFIVFTACLVGMACNPHRRINMKNLSGKDAEVIWTILEHDSLAHSPFFMNNSRTVRFELKPKAPYNQVKMSFGVGSWALDTLAMTTSLLESLEIRSAKGTIRLDTSEIYTFLANRRKGIGKKKIEIVIRE